MLQFNQLIIISALFCLCAFLFSTTHPLTAALSEQHRDLVHTRGLPDESLVGQQQERPSRYQHTISGASTEPQLKFRNRQYASNPLAESNQNKPRKFIHNPYYSHWMEHIRERLSKQSLTQIFLPGTHEASAYNLTNVASPDEDPTIRNYAKKYGMLYSWVVKPWSTNQALDTYGQLMRGARFLDWRISYRAGDDGFDEGPIDAFFSAHGLWASNLEVMLEELIHFLNETSYEIVMMELSHFYEINEERYARMQQLIADTVGPYLITYNDFPLRTADDFFERVTYQDIINLSDKRKRVLLFLDPLELNSTIVYPQPQYGFFNISSLEIPWADTSKTQKMMDFEGQHLSASSGRWNQLYGVQFLLTEQEFDIIEGIIGTVLPGFNLDSIEKLSRFANSRMDEFFEKWLSNRKVSNMIVDRIENTPVVDHAIRINAQACNDNPVYRDPTTVGNCQELKKKGRCDSPDDFMRQNCALTCQLCPKIHGLPGDECVSDSDCESSLGIGAGSRCKTSTSRCLIPDPYPVDHSCGADYQCETGFCNMQTSLCSGRFLGDKCEKNVDCLYGTCQQEICNGTVSHHIVGVTPICRTFEEDCLRNGLLYITKTIGDMEGICKSVLGVIHGNKMICTNARLPVKKFYWLGCGSKLHDCVEQHSYPIISNRCGQYDCCDEGETRVLCGSD